MIPREALGKDRKTIMGYWLMRAQEEARFRQAERLAHQRTSAYLRALDRLERWNRPVGTSASYRLHTLIGWWDRFNDDRRWIHAKMAALLGIVILWVVLSYWLSRP